MSDAEKLPDNPLNLVPYDPDEIVYAVLMVLIGHGEQEVYFALRPHTPWLHDVVAGVAFLPTTTSYNLGCGMFQSYVGEFPELISTRGYVRRMTLEEAKQFAKGLPQVGGVMVVNHPLEEPRFYYV